MDLSGIEDAVHQAWADELKISELDPDSNFFLLGGNSLAAVRVVKRLSAALGAPIPLQVLFRHPTPAEFSAQLTAAHAAQPAGGTAAAAGQHAQQRADGVAGTPTARLLPSPAQIERLQCYDECGVRSDPVIYQVRLSGPLQPQRLEHALRTVTWRHDGLLMRFATDIPARALTGGPQDLAHVRVTLGDSQAGAVAFDCLTLDGEQREHAAVEATLQRFAGQDFDLAHGPRVRGLVLRLAPTEWIFALSVDHITFDLAALPVFLAEVAAVYDAGEARLDAAGLGPAPSYCAFAERQWALLAQPEGQARLRYWAGIYRRAGIFPDARIGALGGQHADRPGAAKRLALPLPDGELSRLRRAAARAQTTPFNMVLAAFLMSLRQRVDQDLLGVVVPLANRTEPGSERLVGLVTAAVPIWVDLAGADGLPAVLARVTEATLASIDNCLPVLTSAQAYLSGAFGGIGHPGYADPSRRAGGASLELYVTEPADAPGLRLRGLESSPHPAPRMFLVQGGLMVYAGIDGQARALALMYPDKAYDDGLMLALLEDMHALLSAG
jgi:hypothetical protein